MLVPVPGAEPAESTLAALEDMVISCTARVWKNEGEQVSTGWVGAMEQPTSDDGTGDAGFRYRRRKRHFLLHLNNIWLNMWTSHESRTLPFEDKRPRFVSVPFRTRKFHQTCSGSCPHSRRCINPSENPAKDAERYASVTTRTPGSLGAKRTKTTGVSQTQR